MHEFACVISNYSAFTCLLTFNMDEVSSILLTKRCTQTEVEAPFSGNYTWTVMDGCASISCLVEIEFVSVTMVKSQVFF
jgi:hypothetical protein